MNMGQSIVPNKNLMGQLQEWSKVPAFRMASFASDDSAKSEASETDKVMPRSMVKLEAGGLLPP